MNTVVIQEGDIRLNSNLNEYAFGKTKYFSLLSEKGLVFHDNHFDNWSFTDINAFKDNVKIEKANEDVHSQELVFYCGKNPLSEDSKTLLDLFREENDTNSTKLYDGVLIVVKAMTFAAENNIKLPIIGAGGIIVDTDKQQVLFLPENIFNCSTNLLSPEDYFMENSGWTNSTVTDLPALCYERALIVYKLLTKRFPYTSLDMAERNADILDKNFIPLEICIPEINENLAKDINRALTLTTTTVTVPGKRKKGVDSEALKAKTSFDYELLESAWKVTKETVFNKDELNKKAEQYLKNKKKSVSAKRNIRRNTATIITIACVAVVVLIISLSSVYHQKQQISPSGMTSTEIIQGFFKGMNERSMNTMNPFARGSSAEKYINNVSEIFLIEKEISSFTKDGVYADPANWIINITDDYRYSHLRVYGVSNLTIDGILVPADVELHTIGEEVPPLLEENNMTLKEGDKITHDVEYYMLQTNGGDFTISVEKVKEHHTLTYKNKAWIITDISAQKEEIPVDTEEFKKDYFGTMTENNSDVLITTNLLREKYPWLPDENSITEAYVTLIESL